ncbi:hypothetical protein U1Q18_005864 [Sarracenia purpurea var. burkii]
MGSSSGNSSESNEVQNSGADDVDDRLLLIDERKRKRMESNRESARRSRMRKQKHLDDLMGQAAQLRMENNQIVTSVSLTTQHYVFVEAQNSVLRAQIAELTQRLQYLTDILGFINSGDSAAAGEANLDLHQGFPDGCMNSWNWMYLNQPIMASADMFQY